MFEEPKKVQQIIRSVASGSQIVAGATSAFIIYAVIGNQLPPHWHPYLVITVTTLAAVFVLSIVELFPKTMLPSSLDMLFSKKTGIQSAFVIFTLLICLGLQGVSILTSYHSRTLIAKSVVKAPPLVNESSYILKKDSLIDVSRQRYDKRIEELRDSEQERLSKAQKEKRQLLSAAIASKGKQMQKLYHEGNSWAKNQLRKANIAATDKGNAQIQFEQKRVNRLTRERDSLINHMEKSSEMKHGIISRQNHQMSSSYEAEIERYNAFACWFGMGGTIVFVLMQILASIHRRATGLQLIYKTGAPPLLYAIFSVFTRIVNTISRAVYKIAEQEEMQPIAGNRLRRSTAKPKGKRAPQVLANRIDGNRKDGYEITCLNCKEKAVKRSPKAKYCSDDCRITYNQNKHGYNVGQIISHRKRSGKAKV